MEQQQNVDPQQIEAMKKSLLKRILSKEAWERLNRLRLVKGETASNLELYLLQLYQSGKIKGEVSDSQMRQILELVSPKKEFKIRM
jgi:programmed cell death protein 5